MTMKSVKHNPFKIVSMFEEEVAEYTGSPYAVAVDSCTSALFLSLLYNKVSGTEIIIPKRTYLSVPQAIILAGGIPVFKDIEWSGQYRLNPYPIIDSAKRLTSDMYISGTYTCLSFHFKKTLPIGKGGMILTEDKDAVEYFKKIRYNGRSEISYHEDNISLLGYNNYMTPEQAARGLSLMFSYPEHSPDLNENYSDLSKNDLFNKYKVIQNTKD